MGLEFRPIIDCDKYPHDNVDDNWQEGYYILKQLEEDE